MGMYMDNNNQITTKNRSTKKLLLKVQKIIVIDRQTDINNYRVGAHWPEKFSKRKSAKLLGRQPRKSRFPQYVTDTPTYGIIEYVHLTLI